MSDEVTNEVYTENTLLLVEEAYRYFKFERLANEDGIGPESLLFLRLLHPISQHFRNCCYGIFSYENKD